jgi:hypothetical protein
MSWERVACLRRTNLSMRLLMVSECGAVARPNMPDPAAIAVSPSLAEDR